jgi:nucleotide-binding universal stress UspA family protein
MHGRGIRQWLLFAFLLGVTLGISIAQPTTERRYEVVFAIPTKGEPIFRFPAGLTVALESVQVAYDKNRQPLQQVETEPKQGEYALQSGRVIFSQSDRRARVRIVFKATPKRAMVLPAVSESPLPYLAEAAQEYLNRELTSRGYELIPWEEARSHFMERKLTPDWLLTRAETGSVSEVAEVARAIGADLVVLASIGSRTRQETNWVPVVRERRDRKDRGERNTEVVIEPMTDTRVFMGCRLVVYDGDTGRVLINRELQDDTTQIRGGYRATRKSLLQKLIATAFRETLGADTIMP